LSYRGGSCARDGTRRIQSRIPDLEFIVPRGL